MGDTLKVFVAGVVAIGLVAAAGVHASGLTNLTRVGFKGGSGLLQTAENG
jgi:hypothetical protein